MSLMIIGSSLAPSFIRNILRFVDYRKSIQDVVIGAGVGIIGWLIALIHLMIFDRWYLSWGSSDRLLEPKDEKER
jgi:hypothetical protein